MSLRQHRPVLAITLVSLAVTLFSAIAAAVKYLGKGLPVGEIVFARSTIGAAALVIVAWHMSELKWLGTRNWRAHFLRSFNGTLSMFTWFMALNLAPIADVTAVTFATPMFVTLLAIPMLGERIHAYRWTAVAVGLCGVFIIMAPRLSFADSGLIGLLLAALSALTGALARIFVRGMSDAEHPITITFYYMLASAIGGACTLPWGWLMPTPAQWGILIFIGVVGIVSQLMLTAAFRYAEASIISPLEYISVITATLLGYLLFHELPGLSFWIGAPLIIAAGLLILWREYRLLISRNLQPL